MTTWKRTNRKLILLWKATTVVSRKTKKFSTITKYVYAKSAFIHIYWSDSVTQSIQAKYKISNRNIFFNAVVVFESNFALFFIPSFSHFTIFFAYSYCVRLFFWFLLWNCLFRSKTIIHIVFRISVAQVCPHCILNTKPLFMFIVSMCLNTYRHCNFFFIWQWVEIRKR